MAQITLTSDFISTVGFTAEGDGAEAEAIRQAVDYLNAEFAKRASVPPEAVRREGDE